MNWFGCNRQMAQWWLRTNVDFYSQQPRTIRTLCPILGVLSRATPVLLPTWSPMETVWKSRRTSLHQLSIHGRTTLKSLIEHRAERLRPHVQTYARTHIRMNYAKMYCFIEILKLWWEGQPTNNPVHLCRVFVNFYVSMKIFRKMNCEICLLFLNLQMKRTAC